MRMSLKRLSLIFGPSLPLEESLMFHVMIFKEDWLTGGEGRVTDLISFIVWFIPESIAVPTTLVY